MRVSATTLPDVLLIEPKVFGDERGFFLESYHQQRYSEAGLSERFVQDNHSRSVYGTLRGLHAQLQNPQGKLIRVIEGEILDVAVDIRRGSPTFSNWVGNTLSSDSFLQCYIPPGFAHGFCVTSKVAQIEYKCTAYYDPESEISIAWNDPSIGIRWPVDQPTLSPKDANAAPLSVLMDHLPRYAAGSDP